MPCIDDACIDDACIERDYGWVLALRAITSSVKEIGRVTYDISNKPPATIEWE